MNEFDGVLRRQLQEKSRALAEQLAAPSPANHTLVSVRYASASLADDDYFGWHWKCSCGTEASPWIQNWPQSEDEARHEWRLHFEEPDEGSAPHHPTTERTPAMDAETPDPDQVLPYLIVNTGGHPIARFANVDHARQYSAGWLGLLPPINTATGATVEDALAKWRAQQQTKVQHSDTAEW